MSGLWRMVINANVGAIVVIVAMHLGNYLFSRDLDDETLKFYLL